FGGGLQKEISVPPRNYSTSRVEASIRDTHKGNECRELIPLLELECAESWIATVVMVPFAACCRTVDIPLVPLKDATAIRTHMFGSLTTNGLPAFRLSRSPNRCRTGPTE